MNLATVKYYLNITFITIIAAIVLATFLNSSLLIYIMLVFFAIFAVLYLGFWRCPDCKKHLGKLNVKKCKRCGKNIYEQ